MHKYSVIIQSACIPALALAAGECQPGTRGGIQEPPKGRGYPHKHPKIEKSLPSPSVRSTLPSTPPPQPRRHTTDDRTTETTETSYYFLYVFIY